MLARNFSCIDSMAISFFSKEKTTYMLKFNCIILTVPFHQLIIWHKKVACKMLVKLTPTFYEQLLFMQILKAHKDTDDLTVFALLTHVKAVRKSCA